MSAKFNLSEQGHIVNILPPKDINGAAQTSDYFHLKGNGTATILLALGVTGAASTVTLVESDDAAGSATTAIAFRYRAETTDAGDTFDSGWTTATSSGFATSTNNNIMYAIYIDSSELTDGYPFLALKMSDPGVSTLAQAVAILGDTRYQQNVTDTAIA